MALTSEFKDAVQNQNKVRVRIMLKDSLLLDPSGDNFQQMLDYAKVQIPSLVDEHDGEVCPAKWREGEETLKPSLDLVGKI